MALASWVIEEVRAGTIRLWHGLIANIPAGYVLCNGNNGTPDLRDKFVKGAAAGQNPGQTGGSPTHTHAQHPALSHSGVAVGDHAAQSHSGGAVGSIAASGASSVKVGTSASNAEPSGHTHPAPSFTQPSPHTALTHSVTQPSQHNAQGHDIPNSEPAYYTVAYIMKT